VPVDEKGNADASVEVEAISSFIVDAVECGKTITRGAPAGGEVCEPTPAKYGDFMIITKVKEELDPFARRLQELGAPCQVSGGKELGNLPELKMLLYCLKAVVDPDNPVLLVGALRSELFGVSDQALYRYKKGGGRFDYRAVKDVPTELPEEERKTFTGAFERMVRYSALLSRLSISTALEKIAEDLGLFALAGAREGGDVAAGSLAKSLEILRSSREGRWTIKQALETLGR